jgi:hypothetical protein
MMSDAANMGNVARGVTLAPMPAVGEQSRAADLLFLLFLPEIISGRPRLCGRNPGLSTI